MKPPIKLLLIPIFFLVTSCADEDLAMLGAVATGAAANYAGANGDAATASSLLDTQQQIMNEQANTEAYNSERRQAAPAAASSTTYVTANAVPGKPGYAISPTSGKAVDVKGILGGALVEDPTAPGSRFRVPQSSSASAPSQKASGISGTWLNSKLTWKLGADGNATLTVPSVNSNGVATTYMIYEADPNTGVFSYTISRATLTGTLNCNGQSDYDMAVNKSYTERYQLRDDTLTIGTEVMQRN